MDEIFTDGFKPTEFERERKTDEVMGTAPGLRISKASCEISGILTGAESYVDQSNKKYYMIIRSYVLTNVKFEVMFERMLNKIDSKIQTYIRKNIRFEPMFDRTRKN